MWKAELRSTCIPCLNEQMDLLAISFLAQIIFPFLSLSVCPNYIFCHSLVLCVKCTIMYFQRQFSKESLGVVFSNAVLANSLTAIACGLVAQAVAVQFGFV